jgi:hypothetical protein
MKPQALLFVSAVVLAADTLPFPPIKGPTEALAKFASEAFVEVFLQKDTTNLTAAIEKYISPNFNLT